MQKFDLHTHTVFSDGHGTPEESVQAAVALGLEKIGISDHSYTSCDESYCMKKESYGEYISLLTSLKEKYRDKITVLCGIEQDYYADLPTDGFDYAVGSVHYVIFDGEVYAADGSPDELKAAAEKHFGGDIYSVLEAYYENVGNVLEKTGADIIGHFDVISKYNAKQPFFDEKHPRYTAAWKKAADKLLKYGKPFEINTGAIPRGARTTPYPSPEIREYILSKGGVFILSSDAHSPEHLCFGFEEYGV